MVGKKYLGILSVLIILALVGFVSAATTLNLPVTGGNYSTSMAFNCTTTLASASSAYLYYNTTGGTSAIQLGGTMAIGADGTTDFYNAAIDISARPSLATYNFTCKILNSTGSSEFSVGKIVTIDNTVPSLVNFSTGTESNLANFSRTTMVINVTATDTLGLKNITINLYNSTSLVNSTTTTSSPNSVNITVPRDGLYYFNATACDYAGNCNSSSGTRTVRVDMAGPAITISGGSYSGNYANITLNATAIDAGVNVVSALYFNITNSTGGLVNSTINGTQAGNTWSLVLRTNTTLYPDGNYTVRVVARDSLNNINSTTTTILYIDRTAPSSIVTAAVTTGQTAINFSITATDSNSGVSSCEVDRGTVEGILGVYESGLTCNTAYTYVVNCTDAAGNVNTTGAYTVTTSACDEESSSSGGGSSVSVSTTSLTTGITENLLIGTVMNFNLGTVHHTLMVTSIRDNKATIRVSSEPQYATLAAGEQNKFDLNNDSTYDLLVKVNSITGNKADVTVKSISESVAGTTAPTVPTAGDKAPVADKVADAVKSVSSKTYWWIAVVIIIIAIVLYLVFRRKN